MAFAFTVPEVPEADNSHFLKFSTLFCKQRKTYYSTYLPFRVTRFLFAWGRHGGQFIDAPFSGDRGNNLATVKAPVLDENIGSLLAADDNSGDI